MTHEDAVSNAQRIAREVLAPAAAQNDDKGRFPTEAVAALGETGSLGLMLPVATGGSGLGPRTLAAVTAILAQADASVAMIFLMHVLGSETIAAVGRAGSRGVSAIIGEIAPAGICRRWRSARPARAATVPTRTSSIGALRSVARASSELCCEIGSANATIDDLTLPSKARPSTPPLGEML